MTEPIPELWQHMQPNAAEAAARNATGLGVPAAFAGNAQAGWHYLITALLPLGTTLA